MNIVLGIPCYNCEKQIERVLNSLSLELVNHLSNIIIIDNSSLDNTVQAITTAIKSLDKSIQEKIILYKNVENYGLGGSFKSLIESAKLSQCDYLAVLHGDDQASSADLLKIIQLEEVQNSQIDCVFGARFMKESKLIGYSKVREFGNQFINLIFSLFTGRRVFEIGSGLNVYKIEALPLNEINIWPNHIAFDVNLLLHFMNTKYSIRFFPISWTECDQTSNAKNIKTALLVLNMLFRSKLGLKNTNQLWNTKRAKERIDL